MAYGGVQGAKCSIVGIAYVPGCGDGIRGLSLGQEVGSG